jgi:hypothetical protein
LLLFKSKYDRENLNGFSELQTGVINALVLPEARELINLRSIKHNVCSSLLTTKIRRQNSKKDQVYSTFYDSTLLACDDCLQPGALPQNRY